ncbi:hypothetical protein HVA01_03340 [Halovibrio variabilis]|uniref:Uncharacterized protein n=2 Tax=Halovibrio variabilis TaxID=31910 RepID=A0A511UM08_9GAMM|nr:hypothetical protein HVA01_03340 [Halovibrio variabilis]
MMKKEFSKKLGTLGVSFALMASPLAFADMHEEDEPPTGTRQQSDQIDLEDQEHAANPEPGEGVTIGQDEEPNIGTRQQADLDDEEGTASSVEGDDDDTAIPGTGAESEPPTGTRRQPALDEE